MGVWDNLNREEANHTFGIYLDFGLASSCQQGGPGPEDQDDI